ncbi:phage tail protein, partial [Clostridium niameyense]
MEQFYTLLTDVGKAKIANATALQTKVNFTKLLVGDSNGSYYEPTQDQTKLKNKVWEGGIGNISIDKDNPNWIVLESVIPSNVGGFTIREVGITDEEGDLVIIAKYPQTYKPKIEDGSTKDLTIKTILEVTNAECVTLKVDPSIIIATKEDIENVKKEVTESTLSKEDIQTTINNIKASDIKTENGQTVESQLDDNAKELKTKIPKPTKAVENNIAIFNSTKDVQ